MRSTAVVLLALLALPGCGLVSRAGHEAVPVARASEPYHITVRAWGPATVTPDGFEARFDFHIVSPLDLRRNCMVQELQQEITLTRTDGQVRRRSLSLVEAFRLRLLNVDAQGMYHYGLAPGQRDRHSWAGLTEYGPEIAQVRLERRVFAYVANVADADFSDNGFAHLPRNEDGTLASTVGPNFNKAYQQRHETRGRVFYSANGLGVVYRMNYQLRRAAGENVRFFVDYGGGAGTVLAPEVVYAASR
ncbi:MAG: hypothetical protein KF754_05890 [Planctomycetes bacterium]|nr:hypothetical protein [Planctomycetota bacterium]